VSGVIVGVAVMVMACSSLEQISLQGCYVN
jgi:hypothetical protein